MTSGPMRGPKKTAPDGASRHPDSRHTRGHGDSMTESATSVKIPMATTLTECEDETFQWLYSKVKSCSSLTFLPTFSDIINFAMIDTFPKSSCSLIEEEKNARDA